jgi:thiamine-monophosphate kinase
MASLGEFEFIDRLLKAQATQGQTLFQNPLTLGIGDDAALIPPLAASEQLVVATDMLVEGRHYFPDVDPRALGHKVLAVNLSDLAAMGARPVAFTLAAGLASINTAWLESFLQGLFALARDHQCALVGGDTVRVPAGAPAVFSVTVMGAVAIGSALRRDAAVAGDDLWVSGHLGDPSFAVLHRLSDEKLNYPTPRVALGQALRGHAHAAIDISDGLVSEVTHLLKASGAASGVTLGADLAVNDLPLGPRVRQAIDNGDFTQITARAFAATSGDEYELCFTAPPSARSAITALSSTLGCPLSRIGQIRTASELQIVWQDSTGAALPPQQQALFAAPGFDHFRGIA